jgi:hypothetical protein
MFGNIVLYRYFIPKYLLHDAPALRVGAALLLYFLIMTAIKSMAVDILKEEWNSF